MKVVIIEDEYFSAEKLCQQLNEIDSSIEVLTILPSVEACLEWFTSHPEPDLIFSDIQLEDQESFELFRTIKVHAPIIYTTAFDHYALKAFKQNSIDYLLKPIDIEELRASVQKYQDQKYRLLKKGLQIPQEKQKEDYKQRFLVKKGNQFVVVKVPEIAYFKSDQKLTFLITTQNEKYILDQSLDQLMEQLNPEKFCRISRNRIVSLDSIKKIHHHFNGRLKLELEPAEDEEVFVSRERVQPFKDWLNL